MRWIFGIILGPVTFCYLAEDLGSQGGLRMLKEHIKRFLFPGMNRMVDLAQSAGVYVFRHGDGAIGDTTPDMIELGIDALNRTQWRLPRMDREGPKRDFGDKHIFHGGDGSLGDAGVWDASGSATRGGENLTIFRSGGALTIWLFTATSKR
ncbi:MAG: hypothetical protein N3A53_03890 [Verrucomicrobiae bacterium]|nr:hypothetical protein [Verrucomicrobiae bacterium]